MSEAPSPVESEDPAAVSAAELEPRTRGRWRAWIDGFTRPKVMALVAMVLAMRAVVFAAIMAISDPDIWWVAAAGRTMLATGHVPTTNLFSFTDPARPWVMHEWLFAVPFEQLLTRFGPHVFALVAAFGCIATVTPVLAMLSRARHPVTFLFGAFLVTTVFELRMITPRPPHVALAFATATTWLAFRERFAWKHVVAAAVLGLVWANAHGSFPVGMGLLAAGALAIDTQRRERIAAVLAFGAMTLVNPYGLHLHGLVLSYLFGTGEVMDLVHGHVTEFSPIVKALSKGYLDASRLSGLLVLIALGVFALTRRERGAKVRGATALVLCAMTARQLRHLELAGLVGVPLLVPVMDQLLDRTRWRVRTDTLLERIQPWSPLVLAATALVAHAAMTLVRPTNAWVADNLGGRDVPALVDELPAGTRLHASFVQTGLAIWFGAPRGIRVLYDLRNDCYGRPAALDALVLQKPAAPNAHPLEVLDRNRVDAVIVQRTHALADVLMHAPQWRVRDVRGDWLWFAPVRPEQHAP